MKLRFLVKFLVEVCGGQKNGEIEALADASQALKKRTSIFTSPNFYQSVLLIRNS